MTDAQSRAYKKLDTYQLKDSQNLVSEFGREGPVVAEVGFGMGESLIRFAASHPDWDCIGIDLYRPGIGAVIRQCEIQEIKNLRIAPTDAVSFLERIPDLALQLVLIFFPDPWQKKRHHKRRLITSEFGELVATKLDRDGQLCIATDWGPYAEQIGKALASVGSLVGGISQRSHFRHETPYEAKGKNLDHDIVDFRYVRI